MQNRDCQKLDELFEKIHQCQKQNNDDSFIINCRYLLKQTPIHFQNCENSFFNKKATPPIIEKKQNPCDQYYSVVKKNKICSDQFGNFENWSIECKNNFAHSTKQFDQCFQSMLKHK